MILNYIISLFFSPFPKFSIVPTLIFFEFHGFFFFKLLTLCMYILCIMLLIDYIYYQSWSLTIGCAFPWGRLFMVFSSNNGKIITLGYFSGTLCTMCLYTYMYVCECVYACECGCRSVLQIEIDFMLQSHRSTFSWNINLLLMSQASHWIWFSSHFNSLCLVGHCCAET